MIHANQTRTENGGQKQRGTEGKETGEQKWMSGGIKSEGHDTVVTVPSLYDRAPEVLTGLT